MADPSEDEPADRSPRSRLIVVAVLSLIVVVIAVVAFVLLRDDAETALDSAGSESTVPSTESASASTPSAPSETPAAPPTAQTPVAPPTVETPDASATENNATGNNTDGTDVASEPETPPTGTTVLITSQSWNAEAQSIEVVGSVQGTATETSTCTATATGPATATVSVDGTFDGAGTSCGLMAIPMGGLPAGTYQVTIAFESAAGSGTSDPVAVTVT